MGIQLAPIEGTPYAGGTATGIIYLDANGLQRTDGPTVDASGDLTVGGSIEVPNNGVQLSTSARTAGFGFSDGWPSISSTAKAEFIISGTGPAIPSGSSYGFRSTDGVTGGPGVDTKINRVSANVASLTDFNETTLGQFNVGILTATAPAITDTPLEVNGTAGQTAALATFGTGAKITAAEEFSNSGSAAGSESFGAGASCTAADGLAVGPDASSTGVEATAVGADSLAHPYATAVGSLARCTAGSNWNASKTAIGYATYANHTHTICLGAISASTASYQFVAGSYAARIKDVYFGTGVTYATPDATTIHGTGGDGTDIAGADINIAGGIGKGTGAGGSVELKTAAAGSSGSTANTLATRMKIDGEGAITFPGIPTSDPGTGILWSDGGTLKLGA
jgi:hypothetical protein